MLFHLPIPAVNTNAKVFICFSQCLKIMQEEVLSMRGNGNSSEGRMVNRLPERESILQHKQNTQISASS